MNANLIHNLVKGPKVFAPEPEIAEPDCHGGFLPVEIEGAVAVPKSLTTDNQRAGLTSYLRQSQMVVSKTLKGGFAPIAGAGNQLAFWFLIVGSIGNLGPWVCILVHTSRSSLQTALRGCFNCVL